MCVCVCLPTRLHPPGRLPPLNSASPNIDQLSRLERQAECYGTPTPTPTTSIVDCLSELAAHLLADRLHTHLHRYPNTSTSVVRRVTSCLHPITTVANNTTTSPVRSDPRLLLAPLRASPRSSTSSKHRPDRPPSPTAAVALQTRPNPSSLPHKHPSRLVASPRMSPPRIRI